MTPSRIVITGASRGIGAALARLYAGPGVALALVGRDADQLAAVALSCGRLGATTHVVIADVRDRQGLADALAPFVADGVDLVLANAGVALPTAGPEDDSAARGAIDVNFLGALNTLEPVLPGMLDRGRGQVGLVSSLAALAPLATSAGYSASKAALLTYGLAMRERLGPLGVRVNVVCPGFVETEMSGRYDGWRPLMMTPDAAAERIRTGLRRNQPVIAFPRRLALLARASQMVPERVRNLGLVAFRSRVVTDAER